MSLDNMSYEDGIKKMEEIICELESGDLTLDEALDKFKKGVEIYKYCNNILNKVEGEIKVLLKDDENNILEEDFQQEVNK